MTMLLTLLRKDLNLEEKQSLILSNGDYFNILNPNFWTDICIIMALSVIIGHVGYYRHLHNER